MPDDKIKLVLADAKEMTFEDSLEFFRKLTGREPTPEDIEEAREEWEESWRGVSFADREGVVSASEQLFVC